MNNNNENKENENDSLFSRFEDALGSTFDGTNDIGTPENIPTDYQEPEQSGNDERSNALDKAEELEKRFKQERQNRLNRENKLGDNNPNPSDPNRLHRNQMPKPNNTGMEAGKTAGDAAKGAGEVVKGAGNVAKGAQAAGNAAGTTGTAAAGTSAAAGSAAAGGAAAAGTGAAAAAYNAGGAAAGSVVAGGTAAGGLLTNPVGWVILAIIAVLIIVVVILIIVIAVAIYSDSLTDIKLEDGYALYSGSGCEYVTVTKTKSGDDGTYPYEEYIAGVVTAELNMNGLYNSPEVTKALAIAARNFFYNNNDNCEIVGNDLKQAFEKPKDFGIAAAKATEGVVMLSNGKIFPNQYDAFAVAREDEKNYYLYQQNQAVPKDWADSVIGQANLNYYKTAKHGNGLSQWGSAYLASKGYDYEGILRYYYGDITLAKAASALSFNPNVTLTKTPGGYENILTEPLDQFLAKNGSSIAAYNNTLFKAINEAGYGTREGVVAAGYSLITILDQNYHKRFPYANGGHSRFQETSRFSSYTNPIGVDGAWGTPGIYNWVVDARYYGMDCNAFVSWAVFNGGYQYYHFLSSATGTKSELANVGINVSLCSASSSSCVGKPGDLLFSSGHIMLIVGSNESKYFVAESSSRTAGMKIDTRPRSSEYTVMDMTNYYNKRPHR